MKRGVLLLVLISLLFLNIVSASQLKVTSNHPFLINNNWIEASQLQVGDLLTTIDGKRARITNIEDVASNVQVYNLEDSLLHNYVVSDDNIIVHNSKAIAKPVLPAKPGITEITVYHGSMDPVKTHTTRMWGPNPNGKFFVTPSQSIAKNAAGCEKVLTYKIPVGEAEKILGQPVPYNGLFGEGFEYQVSGENAKLLHKYLIPTDRLRPY